MEAMEAMEAIYPTAGLVPWAGLLTTNKREAGQRVWN